MSMKSQTSDSKRAPREFRNWRVQGNPLTLCQPFANPPPTLRQPSANPSPTLRQPFANPSPTLCQPLLPTPLQAPLSVGPRHPFGDTGLTASWNFFGCPTFCFRSRGPGGGCRGDGRVRGSSGHLCRGPHSRMCKWMRPFWGTDCRRARKSLSSAQAAPLCSAGIETARECLQGEHSLEMLSQYPRSVFQGFCAGVQQQFASQTLRFHLLVRDCCGSPIHPRHVVGHGDRISMPPTWRQDIGGARHTFDLSCHRVS